MGQTGLLLPDHTKLTKSPSLSPSANRKAWKLKRTGQFFLVKLHGVIHICGQTSIAVATELSWPFCLMLVCRVWWLTTCIKCNRSLMTALLTQYLIWRQLIVNWSMGRQPCCDKQGVKRGPWTAEEDKKLISFILTHGRCCWRAVPKLAGLLRCGKSCRLRWTNYLRPDLKRGLLSTTEEQLVIDLHAKLGNRYTSLHGIYIIRVHGCIHNILHVHPSSSLCYGTHLFPLNGWITLVMFRSAQETTEHIDQRILIFS